MAVPNTTTFTLQNVVDEIAGPQTSLIACFADAASSGYDPLYEGTKTNLLNFRNYVDVNLVISPTTFNATNSFQSFTLTITSDVSWTVTDNVAWISTSPSSGSNNGSVSVTILSNGGAFRAGIITVTGGGRTATCAVSQAS